MMIVLHLEGNDEAAPQTSNIRRGILPLIGGTFGIDDIRTRCHSGNWYRAASRSGEYHEFRGCSFRFTS